MLGTAGLPHILIRFYTVPTAQDARKSVLWAIGLIGIFYLFTLVLGFGAAALLSKRQVRRGRRVRRQPGVAAAGRSRRRRGRVDRWRRAAGRDRRGGVRDDPGGGRGAHPGLSTSVAHDVYNSVIKGGKATEKDELKVARISAFVIGAVAILLAIPAKNLNVAFLVALAFAVAASANLPSIVYNMFWRRLQHPRRAVVDLRRPDLVGRPGVLLARSSPARGSTAAGKNLSLLPTSIDISWFPLENPGIVSIPLGFLLGYIGSVT